MTTELLTPVNTNVCDESFYSERFLNTIKTSWSSQVVTPDKVYCEIYKNFAIVIWTRDISASGAPARTHFSNFIWEVGGLFDHLKQLNWIAQGCVSTGYNATTLEQAIKKSRKKIDLLALLYAEKSELQALSCTYTKGINRSEEPVYNARVGDVVRIQGFGRARLGKIVKTTGNRFIVAYMTPSNAHDVHYKTLPLDRLYEKENKN
jgi:hypothetical protein